MIRSCRHLVLAGLLAASIGCASTPMPPGPSLETMYENIHRSGARDAVDLLREGMRSRQVYGVTDPFIPLRTPEEVIPIWVPSYVDSRTGRRVEGHWQHVVIRRSQWYTD